MTETPKPMSIEAAEWIDRNPGASPEEKVRMMLGDLPPEPDTPLNRKLAELRKAIDDQSPWAVQKVAFLSVELEISLGKMRHDILIAQEREACAKLCETFEPKDDVDSGPEFAAAIRGRGATE